MWRLIEQITQANVDGDTIELLKNILQNMIRLEQLGSGPLEGLPDINGLLEYATHRLHVRPSDSGGNGTESPPYEWGGIEDIYAPPDIYNSVHGRLIGKLLGQCSCRSIFRTKGCGLGMGHSTIHDGDEIWLLSGSEVPFVLRRLDGGRHLLIGEAYLHGAMFGELWPTNNSDLEIVELE